MTTIPTLSELQSALCLSDTLINKDYLNHLDKLPIIPPILPIGPVKFLKITHIPADTDVTLLNYFTFVLNALHTLGITFSYILRITHTVITPYFAISYTCQTNSAFKILEEGLQKTYPGIQLEWLHIPDFEWHELTSISSVSLIPKTNTVSSTTSPLTPLINLMKDEEYLVIFLASSLSRAAYQCELTELQSLYTTLYPYKDRTHSKAQHCHLTKTDSNTFTHTDTKGSTQTTSAGTSMGNTASHSTGNNLAFNYKASDALTFNTSINQSNSCTQNTGATDNTSDACSNQLTHTKSVVDTDTHLTIDSSTMNYRLVNSQVATLLTLADAQISRYLTTINLPIFHLSTYFLSCSTATSIRAASTYAGLVADTTLHPSFINTWTPPTESFSCLLEYLSNSKMPIFCNPPDHLPVCASLTITSKELNPLISPILQ